MERPRDALASRGRSSKARSLGERYAISGGFGSIRFMPVQKRLAAKAMPESVSVVERGHRADASRTASRDERRHERDHHRVRRLHPVQHPANHARQADEAHEAHRQTDSGYLHPVADHQAKDVPRRAA